MRLIGNLVVLLAAVGFCYGLQASKPHYADFVAPIPVDGAASETVDARSFTLGVERVVFARTLKLDQFGKERLLTTSGVWAVVTTRLAAKDRSTSIGHAVWEGPDGVRFDSSERLPFAAGSPPFAMEPGLPGKGRFVFEIPPDQSSGARLLVTEKLFAPLDSQVRVALGDIARDPRGMPAGTLGSFDLRQDF
jgi:hypothetical protein